MKFFFDNNLSNKIAQAMDLLDQEVEVKHLTDIFNQNTQDSEWLKYIGENKMILLTKDRKILKNVAEKQAIRRYKVGAFILTAKNLPIWEIIRSIVNKWEEMKQLASTSKKPFAYQVPRKGKITKRLI
ncbi:MAG: DUF5615 family PIN-like protein [Candidatus Aminicenantes bacterium]|nr:DUF5615 family PIN-like protein [Candidatus Aminicenantes bacterium]